MRRALFFLVIFALFPAIWHVGLVTASGGETPQSKSTAAPAAQAPPAGTRGYAGQETCATCHTEQAGKFSENPHSRLALLHGGKGVTCEGCHGPGQAHVDSGGDATKIFRFTTASAKETDTRCLSCHAGVHPDFAHSPHGQAGVSCTNCHSIHSPEKGSSQASDQIPQRFIRRDNVHSSEAAANLLKASQPQLCYTCHTDIKPAFAQPFHHQVDEGLMRCTDCHDPHGTFQQTQLKATADQNMICTNCHSEKAGPFAYEHPVVKTEGCTSCHSPHGSPNPRLLNVSNVNTLCLQCHSTSTDFHALGPQGPVHNQSLQYVSCTMCHTQIHGSNASSVFFR